MHSFSSIVIILFSNLLMIIIIIIFYFTLQINSMLFLFILIIIFFKFINYFINYNKNDNINNTNNNIFNINNINYNKNNNISYTKNNIFNIYNTMILGPATQLDPRSVVWQGSQTQPFWSVVGSDGLEEIQAHRAVNHRLLGLQNTGVRFKLNESYLRPKRIGS